MTMLKATMLAFVCIALLGLHMCRAADCDYHLIEKVFQMESKLEALEKQTLDCNKTPIVAFSAYNSASKTPGEGQIVIFQQVLLNEGGGYSPSTGVFAAPVGGIYEFTAHFCNAISKFVAFAIVHNETEVAISTKGNTPSAGCSSVSALLKLKVLDRVTVRGTISENEIMENRHRRASYTGVLINS